MAEFWIRFKDGGAGPQSGRRGWRNFKSNSAHPNSVKTTKKSKSNPEKSTAHLQTEFFLHISCTASTSGCWYSALIVHNANTKISNHHRLKRFEISTLGLFYVRGKTGGRGCLILLHFNSIKIWHTPNLSVFFPTFQLFNHLHM